MTPQPIARESELLPSGVVDLSDPAVDKLLADLDQAIEEGAGHLALESARIVRLMRQEHRRLWAAALALPGDVEGVNAKLRKKLIRRLVRIFERRFEGAIGIAYGWDKGDPKRECNFGAAARESVDTVLAALKSPEPLG